MTNKTVEELISRSNRLGADKRNTNFAGGNTSAKGTEKDPVTGEDVQLLWVKGSGGDLGTLKAEGLAVLRLDRLQALKNVYPGVEREDEMVAAFDYCLHGKGGAAPSIDTAMHGLVDAAHVDHLHPDSGIAIATAADGEALTKEIFGEKVAWVPWRRPGFQLGLDIAAIKDANPHAVGTILGGHGITAWGATSEEAEANSLWIIEQAEQYIKDHGRAEPFGPKLPGYAALPETERRAKAAALAPVIRGLASTDKPQLGHFSDDPAVLEFLESAEHPRLGALGTSCPDHFLRTKVKPLVLDLPADASDRGLHGPAEGTPRRLPRGLPGVLRPARDPGQPRPARRGPGDRAGARRGHVLLRREQADRPGCGGVLPQRHQRDARRRGDLHLRPDRGIREVPDRVLGSGGSQAGADAQAEIPRHPHRAGDRCGVGHRQGHRHPPRRGRRLRGDRGPEPGERPEGGRELGGPDVAIGVQADVTDEAQIAAAIQEAVLAFGGVDLVVNNAGLSISKPLLETTEKDWDLQHNVMAKGSFLVAKAAAKVMIGQEMGQEVRILNDVLFEVLNLSREQAGLAAMPPDEKSQPYLTQAVLAISDAHFYPAPVAMMMTDFKQVQASVFQVARAPGKNIVYLGCLLLIVGIFAMLYVRERRLWVWLAQDGDDTRGTAATLAFSVNRKTIDSDREFEHLKHKLLAITKDNAS